MYNKHAQHMLIVFDVSSADSFASAREIYRIIKTDATISFVAAKNDITSSEKEIVLDQAVQFCKFLNVKLYVVSSKRDEGVTELFTDLIARTKQSGIKKKQILSPLYSAPSAIDLRHPTPTFGRKRTFSRAFVE